MAARQVAAAAMALSTESCPQDADFLQELEQSSLVKQSLADFRRVTGLAAKLISPALPTRLIKFGAQDIEFSRLLGLSSRASDACYQHQMDLLKRLHRKLKPQETYCLAGLVHLAVPVVVSGGHIATILSGKARVGTASDRKFRPVERNLRRWGLDEKVSVLRKAWFQAPLLTGPQLHAAVRLLDQFAKLFAETLVRRPVSRLPDDPPCIAEAKQFVRLHLGKPITTRQAAKAVHLNESYFCRRFHQLSGMTFRAYLAKVRVNAAQAALLDTYQSVSEIAYAVGFQSLQDFDRVFKSSTGASPSAFRDHRRHS